MCKWQSLTRPPPTPFAQVGVLTSLLIVEANNARLQEKKRCIYCEVRLGSARPGGEQKQKGLFNWTLKASLPG